MSYILEVMENILKQNGVRWLEGRIGGTLKEMEIWNIQDIWHSVAHLGEDSNEEDVLMSCLWMVCNRQIDSTISSADDMSRWMSIIICKIADGGIFSYKPI